ncbi:MAG: hypothetical protein SFX73_36525 [Kofleriaceae bacterium]|nr:hypothetical protein [Kofleriaceae bacterium]
MRGAALLLVALTAACTPDIVPGSYFCGPEQACPEGQTCDGLSNICVLPTQAKPFACTSGTESEPNDAFATAQPVLVGASCASNPTEVRGCTAAEDGQDFYGFTVPGGCTTVSASARMAFPLAFEPLTLKLVDEAGATVAEGRPCDNDAPDDGDVRLCIEANVAPSGTYAVVVARTGEDTCDGACAYNRYDLAVQLRAFAAP